jgi:hypothetical protein
MQISGNYPCGILTKIVVKFMAYLKKSTRGFMQNGLCYGSVWLKIGFSGEF